MILVINSGSSSLKFKVFDKKLEELASGMVERIGLKQSKISFKKDGSRQEKKQQIKNHKQALKIVLDKINNWNLKVEAIGHRLVHGGEEFTSPIIVSPKIKKKIAKYNKLAPLHNPANLAGIQACFDLLPKAKNVAVFDTSYYKDLPDYAYIYALPYKFYQKHKIRKYGFHGISHQYVCRQAAKKLKRPLSSIKIISCHLGNGCSITATNNGRAVDTSMGFTPLQGLTMGTRSGDLDPAIPIYLIEQLAYKPQEVEEILNYKSGLKGIFGKSRDMRDILSAAGHNVPGYQAPKFSQEEKNQAKLALSVFIYNIARYIGSYNVILEGFDVLVFTAGIGERSSTVRKKVLKKIEKTAKFKPMVIPTDEELLIAEETKKLVSF